MKKKAGKYVVARARERALIMGVVVAAATAAVETTRILYRNLRRERAASTRMKRSP